MEFQDILMASIRIGLIRVMTRYSSGGDKEVDYRYFGLWIDTRSFVLVFRDIENVNRFD